jgi:tellurite resistance protein TerC
MLLFFAAFIALILVLIALDLGLIGRKAHVIGVREALLRTAGWITLAMLFNVFVFYAYQNHWLGIGLHVHSPGGEQITVSGWRAAKEFFTGYVLEQSLSVDNMFVIATIFGYFNVPLKQQHRVLFWGIMGALILRGIMIGLGVALINQFAWMTYIFGVLLIVTAVKMLLSREEQIHPERNIAVRLARRVYPVTTEFHESHFFVKTPGPNGVLRNTMTPLFLALILVETSDVMFAVDSIPAIFAVTRDPFIVFTSNVFAICGLRSLYFALAGLMDKFKYLKASLVFLLAYIGVKMLLAHHYPIDIDVSLAIIGGILAVGVIASLVADGRGADGGRTGGAGGAGTPPYSREESPGMGEEFARDETGESAERIRVKTPVDASS